MYVFCHIFIRMILCLIPGFVAKKKGRSFVGYSVLAFVLSPLIAFLIIICLRKVVSPNLRETYEKSESFKRETESLYKTKKLTTMALLCALSYIAMFMSRFLPPLFAAFPF